MKKVFFILIFSLTGFLASAEEVKSPVDLEVVDYLNNAYSAENESQIEDKGSRMHLCSAIGWTYGRFNRAIGVGDYNREALRRALRKCKSMGARKCRINDCWRQRRRRL